MMTSSPSFHFLFPFSEKNLQMAERNANFGIDLSPGVCYIRLCFPLSLGRSVESQC